MIILTNCLTERADEGGLKVAGSLTRRIKAADPSVTVVSCGDEACGADIHIPVNKLMLSFRLIRLLRERKEPVLYIPAFARMLPTALRVFLLSVYTGRRLQVILVMQSQMNRMARWLLKVSDAEVIALSHEAWTAYREAVGDRAQYLKAGVDTRRFVPVSVEKKGELRRKYGVPADKPVVLHVGHLTTGRNLTQLLKLDHRFHVLLVLSTYKNTARDEELRRQLATRENITLIEHFVPDIAEVYQLSDVYFFPVAEKLHCIDVPLSVLEAAACGIPVVATPYGELQQLIGKPGFYLAESFDEEYLNALLAQAAGEAVNPREWVLPYDWDRAAAHLLNK